MSTARLAGRNTAVLDILTDGYADCIRMEQLSGRYIEQAMVILMLEDLIAVTPDLPKARLTCEQKTVTIGGEIKTGYDVTLWVDADPQCYPCTLKFYFRDIPGYPVLWHYGAVCPEGDVQAMMREKETPMLHHVAFAYDQYFGTKLLEGKW